MMPEQRPGMVAVAVRPEGWAMISGPGRRPQCRYTVTSGPTRGRCPGLGVATLRRPHKRLGHTTWAYCEQHLYGCFLTVDLGEPREPDAALVVAAWRYQEEAPARLVCGGRDHDDLGGSVGRLCGAHMSRRTSVGDRLHPQGFRAETLDELRWRARVRGWAVPDHDHSLAMCPRCRGGAV